ncbi:flagellar motor protein MotB [Novosphingobium sp. MMS21-SN21R]|uniref:flagellar motor protein MotB n=1 Tax=Novosphingobium sp. MMS21-SN21R TaxID=2969298 RepID=UPI00288712CD|nr:flagellar motor protein MotB [Novosphingobium sp. MMS21-SN21R]MDT0506853.1 flagellar motor protein MotB [Novosphingobium sp. MMS21-SN21R]
MAKAPAKGKNEPPRPIIVKKITVVAAGHHGGAWKVAYADFVTAMMAFFLLMWLLGATTEKQRKGIADYFTPTLVKMRQGSAGGYGVLGGSSLTDADDYPHRAGQTGNKTLTIPRDASGGAKEGGSKVKRVAVMKERLAQKLAASEKLKKLARQVRMVETSEGIRIDLVDDAEFSMFLIGTTVLTPDAAELLRAVGQAVAPDGGAFTVRGHTDSLPWKNGVANNWSLSAGRAEATRQALMRQGIAESRFRRIEGVADREPLIEKNRADPRNRRMSILMN